MLLRPSLASFKSAVLIFHETKAYATPKRRNSTRVIWRKKYGDENWPGSIRLLKPKRNLITCQECGNFHETHTICRHCFDKIHNASTEIIERIRTPKPLWFDHNLSQITANQARQLPSANPRENNVQHEIKLADVKDRESR